MKKLLNFIISKVFKIPLANLDNIYPPVTFDITSADVETLTYETFIVHGSLLPEQVCKRAVAKGLIDELIPYIKYETSEDIYSDRIKCRGVIRIVKER